MTNKKDLTKYIWGFTLGDGGLSSLKPYNRVEETDRKNTTGSKRTGINSHYYLKQLSIHRDYVEWQASILEEITATTIVENNSYVDNRGYNIKPQLVLTTRNHPVYTTMRERIYYNGIKAISPHDLKLLDWEVAAIFYMDDGWLDARETKTKGLYIRTSIASHSYTYGDNTLLRDAFAEKLGIHFDTKRHKQKSGEYKWYLQTSKDNAKRFLEGITPYIKPSFEYKLVERLAPII